MVWYGSQSQLHFEEEREPNNRNVNRNIENISSGYAEMKYQTEGRETGGHINLGVRGPIFSKIIELCK